MAATPGEMIATALRSLALASAFAASLGIAAIVAIIATSVVMRKFGSPLHMTEEVVGLILSVSLLLALPMVTLKAQNVRVAIISNAAKGIWGQVLRVLALLLTVFFFGWLMIEVVPWFEFAYDRNLKTQTSRILLYPWMAAMPLAIVLTIAILLARLIGILPEGAPGGTAALAEQGERSR